MRSICNIESCSKFVEGQGMCTRHYKNWQRNSHKQDRPECDIEKCHRPMIAKGMCQTHYVAEWRSKNKRVNQSNQSSWYRQNKDYIRRQRQRNNEKMKEATVGKASRSGSPWTAHEELIILSGVSTLEAALMLNRTYTAVELRKRRLQFFERCTRKEKQ